MSPEDNTIRLFKCTVYNVVYHVTSCRHKLTIQVYSKADSIPNLAQSVASSKDTIAWTRLQLYRH